MNIKARQIFWFWVSFPTNSTAINARKQYAGKKIWKRQRGKRLRQNKIAYCHLYHCVAAAAAAIKLTRCNHAAHESITVRCIAWADWPVAYCRRTIVWMTLPRVARPKWFTMSLEHRNLYAKFFETRSALFVWHRAVYHRRSDTFPSVLSSKVHTHGPCSRAVRVQWTSGKLRHTVAAYEVRRAYFLR